MVQPVTKEEIYDLTNKYCDKILVILSKWKPSNDTPEGRVIYECMWLKQEIENNRLGIPFYNELMSIRYVFFNGILPDEAYEKGIERYLGFIINLSEGYRVVEPKNYPEVRENISGFMEKLKAGGWESKPGVPELLADLEAIQKKLDTEEEIIPLPLQFTTEYKFFGDPDWFGWYDPFFEGHPELDEMLYEIATEIFTGRFETYQYQDPVPPDATMQA